MQTGVSVSAIDECEAVPVGFTRDTHKLSSAVPTSNVARPMNEDKPKNSYGAPKCEKLARLKAKYDPDNVFRLDQNIKPSRTAFAGREGSPMARIARALATILATASFLLIGSAPTAAATSPFGPVTIVTSIDFSTFPFHGTFQVVDGASLLGCTGGTFVDHPTSFPVPSGSAIQKDLTCTNGSAAGSSFTVIFRPTPAPGPGLANGQWQVFMGTGTFANLQGGGDFSVVPTGPTTGMETLTGTIQFVP